MKVLIIGAGPSGLSVAKALQNRGIYPDIIEKQENIRFEGAGIAIPANGSWALEQLGIDLRTVALPITSMQFTDDQGQLLIEERIDTLHPQGAQFYALDRQSLMHNLLCSLDKRISIQLNTTLTTFSEQDDQVHVELSNGESKRYDLLLGCDGIHSSLRMLAHPEETSEFLNLLVYRTLIDDPIGITSPIYMLGTDRLLMLYPMPQARVYVYGHLFQAIKSPCNTPFAELFASFGGPAPQVLEQLEDSQAPIYIHHMEKSASVHFKLQGHPRVLLLGDAAHAFGPGLQNGAAQAFEDAYVLQDLLADAPNASKIPSLIDAFIDRRAKRIETVASLSNRKVQTISHPEQIQGRNEAIRTQGAPNVNGFKIFIGQQP